MSNYSSILFIALIAIHFKWDLVSKASFEEERVIEENISVAEAITEIYQQSRNCTSLYIYLHRLYY